MFSVVVEYRGLDQIIKKSSSSSLRTDPTFHRMGQAQYFSEMDFEKLLHQIRKNPDYMRKMLLTRITENSNTAFFQWDFVLIQPLFSH